MPADPHERAPSLPGALWHEDEWYVSASALSASVRKLVLKDNDAFLVVDRRGDFPSALRGEFGYYWRGTRYLSRMEMELHGDLPLVLDADVARDDSRIEIELTNGEIWDLGSRQLLANTVYVRRELVLEGDVLFQTLTVHNFDTEPVEVELALAFDSDYADMFEVRGSRRKARGEKLATRMSSNAMTLCYAGLDRCVRRTQIDFEPAASEWTEGRYSFRLRLGPGEDQRVHVRVEPSEEHEEVDASVRAEPASSRRIVPVSSRRPMRAHFASVPSFLANDATLNRVLDRAVRDLVTMISNTPDGLYPYAGIPWYCAPFGRDGAITALQLLPWMPEVARGVLSFQARHQARDFDDFTDREPGKIFHELRTGEMAALCEIPFVPYYGSADSTPLFLILLAEYVRVTNDVDLLERVWPHALAAIEWIERHGDLDGDGFVEYRTRSPVGLRNQGWKDSFDGIAHREGALAEPPVAVCEVQGYVIRAYRGCADLAEMRGEPDRAGAWRARADLIQERLHESFWIDELDAFALALDREKKPCRVVTTNAGHLLWAGAAGATVGRRLAARLVQPDLSTGFGLRTLESGARRYSPLSYHNGSVWPHDNALVAEGLRRYGNLDGCFQVFTGIVDALEMTPDGRVPELFCGFPRSAYCKPVPYPVACAPQAWSSGAMLHFVRTLLGLEVDAGIGTVCFDDPMLPDWIDWLEVHGLCVPGGRMDFAAVRGRTSCSIEIISKPDDVEVLVRKQARESP